MQRRFFLVVLLACVATTQVYSRGHGEVTMGDDNLPFFPTFGQDCSQGDHECYPSDILDCTITSTGSVCGLNHIWLHVDHNRLSLPLDNNPCTFRYDSLSVAKYECQQKGNCSGVTQDAGIKCDGVLKQWELRRGALLDTWDSNYLSWVKKQFVTVPNADLTELFETDRTLRCNYSYESLQQATDACLTMFYCTGVVHMPTPLKCPNTSPTYELRKGGQVSSPNTTAYVFQPLLSVV